MSFMSVALAFVAGMMFMIVVKDLDDDQIKPRVFAIECALLAILILGSIATAASTS